MIIKNERRMVFPFAFSIFYKNSSAAPIRKVAPAGAFCCLQATVQPLPLNSSAAPIRKAAPIGAFPLLRS